ncbi:MAG: class I SAM-dependent methyltransferase [Armatimonadetes bacterium]|nr:class I SAM-dependent methyltransferase [Armatimonadota bacterium]
MTQIPFDLSIPGVSEVDKDNNLTVFSAPSKPTDAAAVTRDTPLESLNLNWREKELPERIRTKHVHRLHPYLGKYIPQLVEIFLRKYFEAGQRVLDPFCGSGTTLVQANELGIESIGYDISAFNVMLCRAKTQRYDLTVAEAEIRDIMQRTRSATLNMDSDALISEPGSETAAIPDTDNEYLNAWFAPQTLRELLAYRHFIETGEYRYKDLLRIILSRSARSARLTKHFDLDFPKQPQTEPYWCYKHSRTCSPTTEAWKFIERYSLDTIARISEYASLRSAARVSIHHQDSREADIPPIDGVITSPPYVGLIDYHAQHEYAYHLFDLEDRREAEIGPAAEGAGANARERYQAGIAQVFKNAASSMRAGGRMIVVAGDRANLYDRIAELAGLEIEAVVKRHVNRRTGRRSSEFFESVFIWRKP